MSEEEYRSDLELTKDTPYLTLTGELWDVYWEYLEKIDCFKGIAVCIITLQDNRIAHNMF